LLDPNAHESKNSIKFKFKFILQKRDHSFYQCHLPPGKTTLETAAAAAISRPGTSDVSVLFSKEADSHFTEENGLFWNFSNNILAIKMRIRKN
jgi:hypothetical protein